MDQNFWLQRWQTSNIGFHSQEVNPLLKHCIESLNLPIGSRIFVPLSGKSIDMWWLAEQGYQVLGVELSTIACHDFFKEHNIHPKFSKKSGFEIYENKQLHLYCGDFFNLSKELLLTIDLVFDSKALVALPEMMRKKYVNHMKKLLANSPKAQLIIIAFETVFESNKPPFYVSKKEIEKLFGQAFQVKKIASITQKELPRHLQQQGYSEMTEAVYYLKLMHF
ncbi:thiopurine S-methyltransferase [Legionella jamestowniensis]|uniref:Thiopurine S-methyltransferase n=1 Tax=Legionella jamestowniensis TaxID=455 RepID=A0A0W0UJU5_9GAMM|nr:thiopurine S-methyltransferase [Legionella jamestowniensis]KTD08194.1 thiopurine S-methyltransferase [Legionella jamestowniensis]OCH98517.1 hypothetical protein A8135_00295 [Legionella jamestowniensis]SFL98637.1 thiopurine S-methyltransferase [Legionella jamestowniensis DSM 19215]